ncbi:MAG: hypothetical protein IT384_21205 [Deltaproteobacteria bacterium]|nr:hypothetical protein [Deltaproteobacteria bacterium]
MGSNPEIREWLKQAKDLALSTSPDADEAGRANMLVLGVAQPFAAQSVEMALREVVTEYERKANAAGTSGLFYAWFDEMSGTLRCSFCRSETVEALPFRCKVVPTEVLRDVVDELISSKYRTGIAFREMEPLPYWSPPDDDVEFRQAVFFRVIRGCACPSRLSRGKRGE